MSFNGGVPITFQSGASVPGTISVTFDEAMAAAGVTIDQIAIGDEFRFMFDASSSSGTFRSSNTLAVAVNCKSELAGTYDYVGSNNFCASADVTGQVTISEVMVNVCG